MIEAVASEIGNPTPKTDDVGFDYSHFCSLEEMQETAEADGWSIEFRQLQAGKLTSSLVSGKCADILLLDHGFSRRIEAVGETPEEHITVLSPAGRGKFRINGQSFGGHGLFLLGACTKMDSVNNEILGVTSMLIPTSLLQQTGSNILDTWAAGARSQTMIIESGAAIVKCLRSLMRATIHQPVTSRWQVERASILASGLAAIIDQHAGKPKAIYRKSPRNAWSTVNRAREFIEGHLTEPIQISKLSTYSAASLSKLERTFRRELQMSPSAYILARRLAAVNRDLMGNGSSGKKISNVAMDHGFHHFGRFAAVYRSQFGELPSETLRDPI